MATPMLFEALREFTTGLLNQLLVNLSGQDGQTWLEELKKFLRKEPCWVAEKVKVYLKELWCGLDLDAVEIPETFQSSGLFTGGVYGLAVPEVAQVKTQAAKANISEMVVDGNFVQIFGSLGENRRRWTESQVVQFCRKYDIKLFSSQQ